jgi:hypothetical protein
VIGYFRNLRLEGAYILAGKTVHELARNQLTDTIEPNRPKGSERTSFLNPNG